VTAPAKLIGYFPLCLPFELGNERDLERRDLEEEKMKEKLLLK
jgi:hypothetical protein